MDVEGRHNLKVAVMRHVGVKLPLNPREEEEEAPQHTHGEAEASGGDVFVLMGVLNYCNSCDQRVVL